MDGASLKKWAIVLLIIHLVLICLSIIDNVTIVTDEDQKAYSVNKQRYDYKKMYHKEPSAEEMKSFADYFVGLFAIIIIVYIIFLVLTGLALKGVFSANRCWILMGAHVAILGCIRDCYLLSENYKYWDWSRKARGAVIIYFFCVIFDIGEAVVLFMLRNSMAADGGAGKGIFAGMT